MNAGIEFDHTDHLRILFVWPLAIFHYCCNHLDRCEFYPNECNHDPDCLCHVKYFHFDRLHGLDFYTLPKLNCLKTIPLTEAKTYYSPACMTITFPPPPPPRLRALKAAKGERKRVVDIT